jgi:uncharacterized protein YjeT (DUF2065 family)
MSTLLLAIGAVAVFEGLMMALVPDFLEKAMQAMRDIPRETRRTIGLAVFAFGVVLIWMAIG